MSIDYTLYVSTTKAADQIVESFRTLGDSDNLVSIDEPGLEIDALSVDHPVIRADIEETYGFTPTVGIGFTLDKFHEDLPGLQVKLARSVVALLAKEKGDAVLEFDSGPPVLKRKNNKLYLNENWSSIKKIASGSLALDFHLAAL